MLSLFKRNLVQNMKKRSQTFSLIALALLVLGLPQTVADVEPGFTSLFNGQNLDGWQAVGKRGPGYVVKEGVIVCPADGGGNLFTEEEYENFVFRFDFKLSENANNGIGIRAPLQGDAAYLGMEIQVLHDEGSDFHNKLKPYQYHGSIYDLFPAKRGSLNKPGEWNTEEIYANDRHIRITVNGQVIVDADLNAITDPARLHRHPGILRHSGHIGFLGHGTHVEFRNPRVKKLPSTIKANTAPKGFTALFNGNDLTHWKGLMRPPFDNPAKRATLNEVEQAYQQGRADQMMEDHWKVKDGTLVFDGKGLSLATEKDYQDFELHVDWKINSGNDSGIYLRGAPQVQIWDPAVKRHGSEVGSGGLYNNQKNPSKPLVVADNPAGEWNHFRILMTGEKVTIYLNNQLVVKNTTLENYWERNKPIYPTGQIELQNHGDELQFKNIYIREIETP